MQRLFKLLYDKSADGINATQPQYINSITHWHTQEHNINIEGRLSETQGCWALLRELDSGVLLSGCVIKVLQEGWGSHGSSGVHM